MKDKILQIAISQLGIQENPKGSNWGQDVAKYLSSVNINFPASWCMAFVYWCYRQASIELGQINPLFRTGGVLSQWNKTNTKFRRTQPQKGDIFIMDFGGGLGHTGMVLEVKGDKIVTIEGNSNDEGSREGFEVCKRERSIKSIKGFIRYYENSII